MGITALLLKPMLWDRADVTLMELLMAKLCVLRLAGTQHPAAHRLGDPVLVTSAKPGPGSWSPQHIIPMSAPASCSMRVSDCPWMKVP